MKKRLLASLLSLAMVLTILPTAALAVGDDPDTGEPSEDTLACTCTAPCTEESTPDCPICAVDITACKGTASEEEPTEPACAKLPGCVDGAHDAECPLYVANDGESEVADEGEPDSDDPAPTGTDEPQPNENTENTLPQEPSVVEQSENGIDLQSINGVISEDTTWDTATTLTDSLIVESGATLTIKEKVTISGNVTISGGGTVKRGDDYEGELLSVPNGTELTLQNITIDGGATWSGNTVSGLTATEAAIRIDGGSATLTAGAVVQNNNHISTKDNSYNHTTYEEGGKIYDLPRYYNMGGGIAVYGGGTLLMEDGSKIQGNAVTNTNYEKVTSGTNRTGNSDSLGGGVAIYEDGTFIMNGGEISGNRAAVTEGDGRAFGGGVGLITRGANNQVSSTPGDLKITFTMNGGTISENSVVTGGGGVYACVDQGDDATARKEHLSVSIIRGNINENISDGTGGGIQVGSTDLRIEKDAIVQSNWAGTSGGGIQIGSDSSFTMTGSTVSKNTAKTYGGGIYFNCNPGGNLIITGGTVSENSSGNSGGGIQITTGLTVTISGCTITGNTCGSDDGSPVANGGGIQANANVNLTLTDCTITGNNSQNGHAGGLYISVPQNEIDSKTVLSGTTTIDDNTAKLIGPNMYVATVNSMTTFENLSTGSKIGIAWNINGVDQSNGTSVISGITEENFGCITYELGENESYVLRHRESNAVLYKAIQLVLQSITTEEDPNDRRPDGQRRPILGLAGEEVNLTEVCGFTKIGYHIDRWAKNYLGQPGHVCDNPYTFKKEDDGKTFNALWAPNEYKITYELNGGTLAESAPKTHTYNAATTLVAPTRDGEGWNFDGWYIEKTLYGDKVETLGATDYTDDITLYAKWVRKIGENTYFVSPVVEEQTYTGNQITPAVSVTKDGQPLNDGSYTVKYEDNLNVGMATATVYIKDAEIGKATFEIIKATPEIRISANPASITGGGTVILTMDGLPAGAEVDVTCDNGITPTENANGTWTASLPNTTASYTFTANYEGDVNHEAATADCTVFVTQYTGGGSSSSGGSSSGSSSSGSSSVSGSGDNVIITAISGTVTDAQMESAVKKANKGSTITIKATGSTSVTLPVGGLADAADNDNDVLLDLRYGEITLSARAIAGMTDGVSSNDKIKVSVTSQTNSKDETISDLLDKGGAVFDVSVEVDGVEIHSFDGTLTITLTVSNLSKISDPHVLHILTDGTKEYYAPDSISGNTITVKGIRNLSTFAVIPGSEVPEEQINPFTDVSTSDYYYDAVLWAADNGVTAGTGATTFSPDMAVSRAQMVTFLWRAHGSPEATGTNPFTDVSTSDYYYDAVLWAVANGVTNGTSATTFSPDMAVTRAQAVTFQWRAAGSPVVSGSSFDDVAADAYYGNAVTWAVANGITNGTSGTTFSPDVVVSRAQAVTFLWRELA